MLDAFGTPSALTLFFFGFGCGLPFLLLASTLATWLREIDIALRTIGLIYLATMTYTLKFVWAPIIDRSHLPGLALLGRRRSWLVPSQLFVVAGLAAMAFFGPTTSLPLFVVFVAVTSFAGATQDAVVDAYRIEIAPVAAQAALASTYTLGYRIGLIASGAGALYLAGRVGWDRVYYAMAALMLVPFVAALLAKEPSSERAVQRPGLAQAFVLPFAEFFRRQGPVLAVALLLFVGLFKLPDQMLGVMTNPFYLDVGYTKDQIATVSKVYGVWIGIAGAFLGGVLVPTLGLRWSLIVAALGVALSNLVFLAMAVYPGELWAFMLAISADNLSQGLAGTTLVAFLSSLTSREFTATQYALLSSLANLPGKLIGGFSGFMVEAWSYRGFFIFSSLSILPTLMLAAWLWRQPKAFSPAPSPSP